MHATTYHQLINELAYVFWVALGFGFLFAAVQFFRIERRLHTWCFLVGSVIGWFLTLWQTINYSMIFAWMGDRPETETDFAIQSAVSIVANGLMTYGLVMIALIHYRRSRLPSIDPRSEPVA